MTTIHWLGAGLSSLPGIKKVAQSGQPLILWNRTIAKAEQAVASLGINIPTKQLDWLSLEADVNPGDVVISMLPATLHLQVAELCLGLKAHFVSSSYVSPQMQALHDKAKSLNLSFVNEVGLDPGLDHLLAHALIAEYQASDKFNKANQHSFRSYCGGFPKVANAFRYKFSWSPLGVLKALKSPAQWTQDGEVKRTEKPWLALSSFDMRMSDASLETFQAYPNRDSLPFHKQYGFSEDWNIQEFVRGTLRLNGWSSAWSELFTEVDNAVGETGLARLAELSDELWDKHQYDKGEADRVVLSVELEVKDPQGEQTLWHSSYGIDEAGDERGSAMARLVSLTVAVAIESLVAGDLAIGVSPAPHDEATVNKWLNELENMNEKVFRHQLVG
ncbi:saccharopine dehydrogenase NADP-binding domain-containing protein [Shewanella eurypsychrophilus]|uniref:Saccharopine dehydrogenase NADP-binding domain-containing protein n=1 Tax=Shewanella eurypsychrophilus TaxID=2593656 RepID=A0ABX6V180_9GAMM|nr:MULTISPECIES: saccharopine dehydrogenase C-terminal domain-containing protein [Shewanella]QFU21078.1 saccharopine dehydrogenase [Shewanella sp. YLB-09]QPG56367.1 saccharopine dehydrogenase NADP-binding domain-containing protein [Shewanella eurypsychrophilus]